MSTTVGFPVIFCWSRGRKKRSPRQHSLSRLTLCSCGLRIPVGADMMDQFTLKIRMIAFPSLMLSARTKDQLIKFLIVLLSTVATIFLNDTQLG
jgi:hypothetical protein